MYAAVMKLKDPGSAITHGIGALLTIAAAVPLIVFAALRANWVGIVAMVVFAVSMLLLKYLSNDITTLMDLSAFDREDDTFLMWHCGPTAKRFCESCGYSLSLNSSGKAHIEGQPRWAPPWCATWYSIPVA